MSERKPADHLARESAIDPSRSFIVQAPAGSGKTSLLTDRLLALLAGVDQPERVLAMTFTRKAAAEMHGRVIEKLRLGLHTTPPTAEHDRQSWTLARAVLARDAAQGWDLLAHPARLRIQTIDSFCASLVRAMPWFSGLGGMPSIVQDARPLYLDAAMRTLALAGEQDGVRRLLEHLDLSWSQAAEAIADMLGRRDHWLPLLRHAHDEAALQAGLASVMGEELLGLAHAMPVGWQQALAPAARLIAAHFAQKSAGHVSAALAGWQAGDLLPEPGMVDGWRALAEMLLTGEGDLRKKVTVTQGCPPDSLQKKILQAWLDSQVVGLDRPDWVDRLAAVRVMPDAIMRPEQRAILKAQSDALLLAVAQLWVCFAERAEVDFIEIAERATRALGSADDPSELLLKLDNRLQHILVDEFQDTSHTQLRLLQRLTAGWQPDDGRTLFLVGDPMQSIYRFRKAEVGLFLKVQAEGVGDVALQNLALTANFRSQGGIVRWVNETFARIFPAISDAGMGAIAYTDAEPWHPAGKAPAVNWHLVKDDEQAQQTVVCLAQEALQRFPDASAPMAILVRSRSHLGDLTSALSAAGVPCRAVELVPLRERRVVVDLLQLARALVHRGDRAAWLAVLRAPWCGLTLGTLHHLLLGQGDRSVVDCLTEALAKPGSDAIDPDQWQRLNATAAVLTQALEDGGADPFAARLESVWRALQGHLLVQDPSDLADAEAFFRLIETVAQHSHVDIDELDRRLQALYAEPGTGERAIDVMTMHKAKGLEFESVVLFGLERQSAADRVPLVRIDQSEGHLLFGPVKASSDKEQDPLAVYLASREAARIRYETDRLLYVAATRAREVLHLVGQVSLDKKSVTRWAEPVKSSLLRRLWPFCPSSGPPEGLAPLSGGDHNEKPQWQAPALKRRLSVASEAAGWVQPQLSHRLAWPVAETAERLSGILVHAWLARFAGMTIDLSDRVVPTQATLRQQLRLLGLPAPLRAAAAEAVQASLVAVLESQRGRWLLSHPLRRAEWSLIDPQQVVSVIDLAIDMGDGWLVVDYKTSRPGPDESRVAFVQRMLERYSPQLQRYVESLTAFDGRPTKAALYFPQDDLWVDHSPLPSA